jgi:hypothetical protein
VRAVTGDETEGGPVDDARDRFAGLYDACYRRVLGYAVQHLEADAAQDVASETFLIAWLATTTCAVHAGAAIPAAADGTGAIMAQGWTGALPGTPVS